MRGRGSDVERPGWAATDTSNVRTRLVSPPVAVAIDVLADPRELEIRQTRRTRADVLQDFL
jgi:hypothetical protein